MIEVTFSYEYLTALQKSFPDGNTVLLRMELLSMTVQVQHTVQPDPMKAYLEIKPKYNGTTFKQGCRDVYSEVSPILV